MFPSVQAAYIFSSTLLLVLTVCWMLFVKEAPAGEEIPPEALKQERAQSSLDFLKAAIHSKKTWLVGLAGGFGVAASESFSGILPQAFAARGMTPKGASMIAAIATVGSMCGSFFGPAIINKARKAKPVMILVALIGGVLMGLTWYVPLGMPLTVALILGGLFGAMTGPVMQAMPITFPEIGPKNAGSAGGLVGTVSLLLSYLVPIIISGAAGRNYELTFIIQGALFAFTAVIIAILPDANGARRPK
ncbi:MFS transporter [Lactobacillus sp. XV13L]|nr:MFS transporter [Lactobacillus sp. XV13L]